jgi:hypothetical protein
MGDVGTYENSEFVEQAYDKAEQQRREQRAAAAEGLSTKKWLETKLEEQARPFPVMGREFLFTPVGNERVEEVLRLASQEAAQLDEGDVDDLEDVDAEHLDDMPEFVRSMRETLEEHCLDEFMAEEGFKKLPLDVLQMVFEDVAMNEGLSEAEGNGR